MPFTPLLGRRDCLAALAFSFASAGCTQILHDDASKERYRLQITNEDSVTHNARITIRRISDDESVETVFNETRAVGENGGSIDLSKYVSGSSKYMITVTVDDEYKATTTLYRNSKAHVTILTSERVRVITERRN